ncbi:MAG: hypothetical protein LRY27_04420 [Chitinophagales bacterium]|nr:hypothetical protein [Chitinophagales bacterium]
MENLKFNIKNTLALRPDLVEQTKNEEELLRLIAKYVQELIDTDFEELLRILYKIDVSEKKVKQYVLEGGPEHAATNIALLILEREKQKIETRKKYSEGESDWEF